MKDRVLSIQKMQKLKELGIDDSKAKMYWVRQVNGTSINEPIDGEFFLSLHKGERLMRSGFMRFETIPTFTEVTSSIFSIYFFAFAGRES